MTQELHEWRERLQINDAKHLCRHSTTDKYSVAVLASGGLLDTLSSIRAGLIPIWGSDTDELSQKLWQDLTGSVCYGDSFKMDTTTLRRPRILKTGFPCPDYTGLGSKLGSEGNTGHLYTKQAELIKTISPDVAIIEQTDNAININHGEDVKSLLKELQTDYLTHHAIIPVWRYGDPTNRKRLFIVAFHRRLGPQTQSFQFPKPTFDNHHYPTAANVSVPDNDVPRRFILEGGPIILYTYEKSRPGHIHHLGNYGPGAGDCNSPHPLQSWQGLANTQLTSNGGSRRVMLQWRPGDRIQRTRLTTPIETIRLASLSSTYLDWIRSYDKRDATLQKLVNNGVPLRTSTIIDQAVIKMLEALGIQHDVPASYHPNLNKDQIKRLQYSDFIDPTRPRHCGCYSQCGCFNGALDRDPNLHTRANYASQHTQSKQTRHIRSMLIDTGASGSLNYTDIESNLQNSVPSAYKIAVAKGDTAMHGSRDGQLRIHVLNTSQQPDAMSETPISMDTTTVSGLRTELFSLDGPFRHGRFNILLRQPNYETGISELYRAATNNEPELRIPLRYDYTGHGGWWLDYMLHYDDDEDYAHHTLLHRHHMDATDSRSEANAARLFHSTYTIGTAQQIYEQLRASSAVRSTTVADELGVNCIIMANDASILARHPDERQIKGVKAGLKHGRDKLPIKVFHKKYAHIGNCDDTCDICRMIKGCMRRIYKKTDPYKETRPAHTWSMDTVTFSHRSLRGNKYATILRCKATGVIKILFHYLKSDVKVHFEDWVRLIRAQPAYFDLGYPAVSVVVTDNAGEWELNSAEWKAMLLRVTNIEMIYCTPETSKEAGHAESTNSIVEEITKAILMQQNLSEDHWEIAAASAEWLLNRFANLATDVTAPINGDQALPLELITRGRYERRQIYRELSYYVMPGTPALVHVPAVKGSTLAPKVRWGIAESMYRDQVVWRCPYVASEFRSKSFTAFDLRDNMNYAQFLSLPAIRSTRRSLSLPSDFKEKVHVHLMPANTTGTKGKSPVTQLHECNDDHVQHIYLHDATEKSNGTQHSVEAPDTMQADPIETEVNVYGDPCRELGGSVRVQRHTEQQLTTKSPQDIQLQQRVDDTYRQDHGQCTMTNGLMPGGHSKADERASTDLATKGHKAKIGYDSQAHSGKELGQIEDSPHRALPQQSDNDVTSEYDHSKFDEWLDQIEYEDSDEDETDQSNLDGLANLLAERDALTSGVNMSYTNLCKQYGIPHELHDAYYEWLLKLKQNDRMRFNQDQMPRGRGRYLKLGMKIPAPHGPIWRDVLKNRNLERSRLNKMRVIQSNHMIIQSLDNVIHELRATESYIREKDQACTAHQVRKSKKKRISNSDSAQSGRQPAPKSISQALRDDNRIEAMKWLESINKEWDGLCDMGVLEHAYTRQELIQMGITSSPVPFSVVLTYKYDQHGEIDRYKTRCALAGHRGNMQPGVHFDKTYSSTPVQHTSKILQAIMVLKRLHRLAFDIKQAYCQADRGDSELLAVRYPEGFRRYNSNGEEQFGILRKNLYGDPAAGRNWEKIRNATILELFNKDGWTCKRCIKEPCLFIIEKDNKRTYMLVWTDDCDLVGESKDQLQEIFTIVNTKWESKQIDPSYMLGIKREIITETQDLMQVELTMTAYVEAMANTFEKDLLSKNVTTPLPDGFFTYKKTTTSEQESKAVLARGYQRLFGSLLWAARGTFPECLEGCSMLGRVMSAPAEDDWSAACHMLTYMHQHRHHGILYSSNGNSIPYAMVDSSNKTDPTDSKCQYGYCHVLAGAAIIAQSKKLSHIGLSAAHNEYMAAHWCNRHTAWLRDLLVEMGYLEVGAQPTNTYADNRAANLLCEEDIITCGNQFMQVPYHYNKEAVAMGVVIMIYISTLDNLADLFTKSVSKQVLQRLLPALLGYSAAVLPPSPQ